MELRDFHTVVLDISSEMLISEGSHLMCRECSRTTRQKEHRVEKWGVSNGLYRKPDNRVYLKGRHHKPSRSMHLLVEELINSHLGSCALAALTGLQLSIGI